MALGGGVILNTTSVRGVVSSSKDGFVYSALKASGDLLEERVRGRRAAGLRGAVDESLGPPVSRPRRGRCRDRGGGAFIAAVSVLGLPQDSRPAGSGPAPGGSRAGAPDSPSGRAVDLLEPVAVDIPKDVR